jgi:anti-sigma factor RsiW
MSPRRCDLERLQDYFDGRLDSSGASSVQAHVRQCAECREVLAGWQQIRDLMSAEVPSLPQASFPRLVARPRVAPASRSRFAVSDLWGWGSIAASLLCLFALWQMLSGPISTGAREYDALSLRDPSARQEWVQQQLPMPEDEPATAGTSESGTSL